VKHKELSHVDGQRTFALVFERGDEAMAVLESFAIEHRLAAAHFSGIGAFSDVTLGYFDWEQKRYEEIPVDEQVEVAAFAGDVALGEDGPEVHAHLVVGDRSGRAYAGHFLRGHVRPTLEIVLTETPAELRKKFDPESGLALIAPES
jgi:predicted DNA-binding protein with PD1-like motif